MKGVASLEVYDTVYSIREKNSLNRTRWKADWKNWLVSTLFLNSSCSKCEFKKSKYGTEKNDSKTQLTAFSKSSKILRRVFELLGEMTDRIDLEADRREVEKADTTIELANGNNFEPWNVWSNQYW